MQVDLFYFKPCNFDHLNKTYHYKTMQTDVNVCDCRG